MRKQSLTFNVINGFHLKARYKNETRAGLMKKDGQLTTLTLIKAKAMQIELILEEKKKKSAICTNENNGNGSKPVLINQIQNDDPDPIEAIRGMDPDPRIMVSPNIDSSINLTERMGY
jgi:hypothetical protein